MAAVMPAPAPSPPPKKLYVLVDFDNLRRFSRGKNLFAVITHLASNISDAFLAGHTHLEFRLYGGWRTANSSTPLAQQLAIEIAHSFPKTMLRTVPGIVPKLKIRLDVNLAYASLFLPTVTLGETYFRGRSPRHIYPEPRPWFTCANSGACVLSPVESFLSNDQCPNPACTVDQRDVLRQDEQKQVDTLMVADLAHLSISAKASHVVLVTSDSDMWPGVMLATLHGTHLLQIQTTPGTTASGFQLASLGTRTSNYSNGSV